MEKKGNLKSSGIINTLIFLLIALVVLFSVYSVVVPEAQTAGNSMNASNQCVAAGCFYNRTDATNPICTANANASQGVCTTLGGTAGVPLAGLFDGNGVIFVIVMAALIILVVRAYLKGKGGK